MSRLSPGLFYKEQAEMTHAKAVRVCGRANKAHLPTFKTQEEYEILLKYLGSEWNVLWATVLSFSVFKKIIERSSGPLWLGLYIPAGSSCSSLDTCQGVLRWYDDSLFSGGSFFTGSFDYLENTDSSLQSCLEVMSEKKQETLNLYIFPKDGNWWNDQESLRWMHWWSG